MLDCTFFEIRELLIIKTVKSILQMKQRLKNINILLYTIDKNERLYDNLYDEKLDILSALDECNYTGIISDNMSKLQILVYMYEHPYEKITHDSFNDYEYLYYDKTNDCIKDEHNNVFESWECYSKPYGYNGFLIRNTAKWDYGWKIYKEKNV